MKSPVVRDAAGRPVSGGIARLFNEDHPQQVNSGIGESGEKQGKYKLPVVPCEDKYALWAERGAFHSERLKVSSLQPTSPIDIVMHLEWWRDQRILTATMLFLYLLSILLFRWHNIAVIDQKLLAAEVAATLVRLDVETAKDAQTKDKAKALREMLTSAANVFDHFKLRNWFFWTRGYEIPSWTLVREVQRQMVCLWPHDSTQRLRARLETAQQDLLATQKAPALALAELIKETLLLKPPDEERWKQLLSEALGMIYGANEQDFFLPTIWQSKSTWLAVIACALVQA